MVIVDSEVHGASGSGSKGSYNQHVVYLCLSVACALLLPTPLALAAPINAQALQQQNQIILQDEQQRRDLLRDVRRLTPPEHQEGHVAATEATTQVRGACFKIDSIHLEDATLLSSATQQRLVKPFIGRCLYAKDLNEILRVITNAYIDKGYVTTRAYIGEQDLAKGTLTVKIIEGNVQGITILENGKQRTLKYTPFWHADTQTLNIYGLEQGLDQINRLASQDATMQISPGSAAGESAVAVNVVRQPPLRFTSVVSNSGLPQTGRRLIDLTLGADDMLGLYDVFSLNYKQDLEGRKSELMNQSVATDFSVPLGYWTLRTMTRDFKYLFTTVDEFDNVSKPSGESHAYTAELERVIYRDGNGKVTLSGGLTAKQVIAYTDGFFIPLGSRHLTIGSMRLGYIRKLMGGVLDSSLTYNRGLTALGALHDAPNLSKHREHAQFNSVQTDIEYRLPFSVARQAFDIDSLLHGQWAPHTLYGTEQISIGGQYTVRGFLADSITADTGAYLRNELIWHLPAGLNRSMPFSQVDAFAGLDAGWVDTNTSNGIEGGTVQGMVLGMRANGRHSVGELSVEHALHAPSVISYSDYVVRFKLGAVL